MCLEDLRFFPEFLDTKTSTSTQENEDSTTNSKTENKVDKLSSSLRFQVIDDRLRVLPCVALIPLDGGSPWRGCGARKDAGKSQETTGQMIGLG